MPKCEGVPEQMVRIGRVFVAGPHVRQRTVDHFGVVVDQVAGGVDRDQSGAVREASGESLDRDDADMGHRQHPAAAVATESIEHLQLPGFEAVDARLLVQGALDRVGEHFAGVQKGAGKSPPALGPLHFQHLQAPVFVVGQRYGVDSDAGMGVFGE